MGWVILIVLAVGFTGYAVFTQYRQTTAGQSVPKRVWASVVAAAGVVGAAIATLFHNGVSP